MHSEEVSASLPPSYSATTRSSRPPARLDALLEELGQKVKQRALFTAPTPAVKPSGESLTPPIAELPLSSQETINGFSAPLRPNQRDIRSVVPRLNARALTKELTNFLTGELPGRTLLIYQALHETALEMARYRGYAPGTTQVSYHVPAEIVAYAMGIHRATLYRHLPLLKERGLLDYRAHHTTLNGRTIADGTLWSIKLHPTRGKSARVSYEDLKHKWRDLAADIEAGKTAFEQMRQSYTTREQGEIIELLLQWALPREATKPALSMTVARPAGMGPEAVLDVPYAQKAERGEMVDTAARAVARYLGDDSINFYHYLLWQLLRLHDRGQDHFERLYLILRRTGADKQEWQALRKPGALLVSRLKEGGLWDLLKTTPAYAVSSPPAEA